MTQDGYCNVVYDIMSNWLNRHWLYMCIYIYMYICIYIYIHVVCVYIWHTYDKYCYYSKCLECHGVPTSSPGPPMSSCHRGDENEENRAIRWCRTMEGWKAAQILGRIGLARRNMQVEQVQFFTCFTALLKLYHDCFCCDWTKWSQFYGLE